MSALATVEPRGSVFVTSCKCGRNYTATGWRLLSLVGEQQCDPGPALQLRNCACGSTISGELGDEFADYPVCGGCGCPDCACGDGIQ